MPTEDAKKILRWFEIQGYVVHAGELPLEADDIDYWTQSGKHKEITKRDRQFLRQYVATALNSGVPLLARGIPISGLGFIHMDKAVMNSCLNGKLVRLTDGIFKITIEGLDAVGLTAEE